MYDLTIEKYLFEYAKRASKWVESYASRFLPSEREEENVTKHILNNFGNEMLHIILPTDSMQTNIFF